MENHREKLLDILKRNLSNEQSQAAIRHIFKEDNWLFELKEFLTKEVNRNISDKMKGEHTNENNYFKLRDKVESEVISETDWYSYFENVSLEQLEEPLSEDMKSPTLMLVVISALRAYIDNEEEKNARCLLLKNIYLNLKEWASSHIPNYPQEDGFIEYLKAKQHRTDLEDARITGSVCPFCEATDVKSYDFNKWQCRNCGKFFRKHRKKEDN